MERDNYNTWGVLTSAKQLILQNAYNCPYLAVVKILFQNSWICT